MAFTVTDFADLVRLLAERPEWQVELRRQILSEDFLALPRIVQELATEVRELVEAQQRTDERLQEMAERTDKRFQELAEAQQRTDERLQELAERTDKRFQELAEAQQRTEQRVEELAEAQQRTEQRVEELAEAQRRTEQRVEELAEAQRRTEQRVEGLATAVGGLQRAFGATVEEEAEGVLQVVLEDKGYRLLTEPYSLALDGEVDVVMEVEAPSGERVWAVVEAKARLGHRQVRDWAQQIKSRGWQQRLAAQGVSGPYLAYAYGIRIDLGAVRAAEKHGIGLLSGRGERIAPQELIRQPTG